MAEMMERSFDTNDESCRLGPSAIGRTLSRALKDEHGRTLLLAGTVLRSAHVESLMRLGIASVWTTRDTKQAGDRLERIERVFSGRLEHPLMAALYAAARSLLERTESG